MFSYTFVEGMICKWTFSLLASFSSTCSCQAKARNAPCTSRDTMTEKRLRKNLEPSIRHSCLMMKVETLNPTNGRKNLYIYIYCIYISSKLRNHFQDPFNSGGKNIHHHLGRWQWSHGHLLMQNYALLIRNFWHTEWGNLALNVKSCFFGQQGCKPQT